MNNKLSQVNAVKRVGELELEKRELLSKIARLDLELGYQKSRLEVVERDQVQLQRKHKNLLCDLEKMHLPLLQRCIDAVYNGEPMDWVHVPLKGYVVNDIRSVIDDIKDLLPQESSHEHETE